ncbi:hypothetical protein RSAG8_11453, partial [Rhizoctonia solani AG-8 WAC10335]
MPHLKSTLPSSTAHINHLNASQGWMPYVTYDLTDLQHPEYSLTHLMDWMNPETFRHQESDTIPGGPFRAKWSVLLLAHMKFNARMVRRDPQRVTEHYGSQPRRIEFHDKELEYLNIAIEILTSGLTASAERLTSNLSEWQIKTVHDQVAQHIQMYHKAFPNEGENFQRLVAVTNDDPWHDVPLLDNPINPEDQGMALDKAEPIASTVKVDAKGKASVEKTHPPKKRIPSSDLSHSGEKKEHRRRVTFDSDLESEDKDANSGDHLEMDTDMEETASNRTLSGGATSTSGSMMLRMTGVWPPPRGSKSGSK